MEIDSENEEKVEEISGDECEIEPNNDNLVGDESKNKSNISDIDQEKQQKEIDLT